jgi:hypothetical protein
MFLEPDFGEASSFTELDEQGLITLEPDEGTQGSYELKVTLLQSGTNDEYSRTMFLKVIENELVSEEELVEPAEETENETADSADTASFLETASA